MIGSDLFCNETTIRWDANDDSLKEFKFDIVNDDHWEHEEVPFVLLFF